MARTQDAVDRINYLMGFDTTRRSTPKTITGDQNAILSYGLTIIERVTTPLNDDIYMVHPRDNSATTNRHITAARSALMSQGFTVLRVDSAGFEFFTRV